MRGKTGLELSTEMLSGSYPPPKESPDSSGAKPLWIDRGHIGKAAVCYLVDDQTLDRTAALIHFDGA